MTAALFLAVPAIGHAAVLDGSFESKGTASAVTNYCYNDQAAGGNAQCGAGSAWGGTSGVIASGNGAWGGTTTPYGSYFAFVQGNGVLSQSLTLAAGSYVLSWFDAARTNNGSAQSYAVAVGSNNLGTFTTNNTAFEGRTSSVFNVATAGTYTLSFSGLSGAIDRTSFIDNVSIAAVPETATWGMMILGFAAAGGAMRRRKASALSLA
jgi:hypothetical protein